MLPVQNIFLGDEANNPRLPIGASTWIHDWATLYPADTTDAMLFSSSNPSVAIVDSYGHINAHGAGTATISITAGEVSTYFWLEVYVPVEAIVVYTDSILLELGEEYQIFASVLPFNATNQQIEYSLHMTRGSLQYWNIYVGQNGHLRVLQGYDRFLSGQVFEGYVRLRADDVVVHIPLTVQNSFAWSWSERAFTTVDNWILHPIVFDNPIVGCTGFHISVWSESRPSQFGPIPNNAWGRNWRLVAFSNNRWQTVAGIRIDEQGFWTLPTTISFSARDVTMIDLIPPSGFYGGYQRDIRIHAIHRN